MEYTVNALAQLAGLTPRTLRWYDREGLLKPCRVTEAGYRIYGPKEVDRLQEILLYRELDLPLEKIRAILDSPGFDRKAALQSHLTALREKRTRLDGLIETVERTLLSEKGEITMTDKEKFHAFKVGLVARNEEKYGMEVKEKYGEATLKESGDKLMGLTEEAYQEWKTLEEEILSALAAAVQKGEPPAGVEGARIALLHRRWLDFTLPSCTPQIQMGLAEMYVADQRFTDYYDRETPGCARFLREAVAAMVGE